MTAARGHAVQRHSGRRIVALGLLVLLACGLALTLTESDGPGDARDATTWPGTGSAVGARDGHRADPPGPARALPSRSAEQAAGPLDEPEQTAASPLLGREALLLIVDQDGAPVPGSQVTVWRSELDLSGRDEPWRLRASADSAAVAAADGSVTVLLPSPGAVLCAGHDAVGATAVVSARPAWERGESRLALLPTCRVAGRVTWDDGRVAADVTVRFDWPRDGGPATPLLRSFWAWAVADDVATPRPGGSAPAETEARPAEGAWCPASRRTDADGRFEVIVHGTQALTVSAASPLARESARASIRPEAGAELVVELVLPAGFGVRGRVIGSDGLPVARAQVHAFDGAQSRTRHAGADGRFELPLPSAGTWAVGAWDGDRVPGEVPQVLLDERSSQAELRLTVVPGALIAGRLVDRAGRPRPWVAVSADPAGPDVGEPRRRLLATPPTMTDDDGGFVLGPVAPGWPFDLRYAGRQGVGLLPGVLPGGEPLLLVDPGVATEPP